MNEKKYFPFFEPFVVKAFKNIRFHYRTCLRRMHTDGKYYCIIVRSSNSNSVVAFTEMVLKCYEAMIGPLILVDDPIRTGWFLCDDQTDEQLRFYKHHSEMVNLWNTHETRIETPGVGTITEKTAKT